ncbi:UNKNOWN [Stylonychia lemnae]|uniref:Uncharacterized protein n=1 Tax=Stylonychia lemnae TaxID=5949 RepID=A0A078A897_STYLE|nr:UNKNOWN [Stylonychia lemnae]|eukprot:CDW78091.1 UNKNOWN [Stylonychia lemnae]
MQQPQIGKYKNENEYKYGVSKLNLTGYLKAKILEIREDGLTSIVFNASMMPILNASQILNDSLQIFIDQKIKRSRINYTVIDYDFNLLEWDLLEIYQTMRCQKRFLANWIHCIDSTPYYNEYQSSAKHFFVSQKFLLKVFVDLKV